MFFVGIDIGKNNHVASMMDESGKVVFKAFSLYGKVDIATLPVVAPCPGAEKDYLVQFALKSQIYYFDF